MKKLLLVTLSLFISNLLSSQTVVQEFLDINDIKAGFLNQGDMFWNPSSGLSTYEYPKGSGKTANFGNLLWIGGKNRSTQNLHMATQGWRNVGSEYWPGPLDTQGQITQQTSTDWNQIWKINKSTIDTFRSISNHTISNTPSVILVWPAKGNVHAKTPTNQQLNIPNRDMAPFVDVNGDGIYNALDGDYPRIKGEQMLWWIFNDNLQSHPLSQAPSLGIEIQASAYACTGLYKEYIFLDLEINNRSSNIYDSSVVALLSEADLGFYFDDYLAFDSSRRMGIVYNGDFNDESSIGYGTNIPHMGTMLLKSPAEYWSFSEPGGSFTYFNNGWNSRDAAPSIKEEYYNYMTGRWRDSVFIKYGCDPLNGAGHPYPYVFPGEPLDTSTLSEAKCNRVPADRRFVISCKPFTLDSAAKATVRYAFINSFTGGNLWSFNRIRQKADIIRSNPDCCANMGVIQHTESFAKNDILLYPNPAKNFFTISNMEEGLKNMKIYNSVGQLIRFKELTGTEISIKTSDIKPGIYFVILESKSRVRSSSILIDQ